MAPVKNGGITVPLTAGEYRFSYRVAGHDGDERFLLQSEDGLSTYSTVAFESTGNWQNWITVDTTVELDSDIDSVRLYAVDGEWNINWFEVTPLQQSASSSANVSSSAASSIASSDTSSIASSGSRSSEPSSVSSDASASSGESSSSSGGGELMRRIEAEDYLNIDGMQVEPTEDVGGGENVGWIDTDDRISYRVYLPEAGEYKVRFRVAGWGETLDRFVLESDDIEGLSHVVTFEGAGGWQSWKTVEGFVELPEGEFTLVLRSLDGDWNINWLEFELASGERSSNSSIQHSSSSESSSVSSSSYSSSEASSSSSSSIQPPTQYMIFTLTDGFGSIEPQQINVDEGGSASFTVRENDGYTIESVSGCDGTLSQDSYSVSGLWSDCTIEATFKLQPSQPGDIIDERYRVNEDDPGVVTDLETGLEWKRCPEGAEWGGSECEGEGERYELEESQSLTFENGWRIPSREELESIIYCSAGVSDGGEADLSKCEPGSQSPTLNLRAFPGAQPDSLYWSGTPTAKLDDSFWAVSFSDGATQSLTLAEYDSYGEVESYFKANLRLVRGDTGSQYNLSIEKKGEGSGEIIVDQEGVDCGDGCLLEVPAESRVEVLAVPDPGAVFARWSGACRNTDDVCVVDVNENQEVNAHFLNDRYEFPASGVVLDNETGLEWQRCTYGQEWTGVTCEGSVEKEGWQNIEDKFFPGGWRLPTKDELASIVYCDSGNPSFEGDYRGPCHNEYTSPTIADWAFPNTWRTTYWSSSTYGGVPVVRDFENGKAGYLEVSTGLAFRLVRDSVPPESVQVDVSVSGNGEGSVITGDATCDDTCVSGYSNVSSIVFEAVPEDGFEFYQWDGLCEGYEPECEVKNWHEVEEVVAIFIDDRYEVRGESGGVIYDSTTDLEWMRCSYGQEWDGNTCSGSVVPLVSSEANSIASEMGWRVPAHEELRTLLFCSTGVRSFWGKHEDRCYSIGQDVPTIAETYFPETKNEEYRTTAYIPSEGWSASKYRTVDFKYGENRIVYSGDKENVRFVRGGDSFPTKTLSLSISGAGEGSVAVDYGERESCDDAGCEILIPEGASVTLSPYSGNYSSVFSRWDGPCSENAEECTFVMDSDREVTAHFNLVSPFLASCPYEDITSDWNYDAIKPENDIAWNAGRKFDVNSIESAFNYARYVDPSVHTYLNMPDQDQWDGWSLQKKGLYLVNAERLARGLKPFSGMDSSIQKAAQSYSDYILSSNQVIGHYNDGRTPLQRMLTDDYVRSNADPFIGKVESVASFRKPDRSVDEDQALVRAIYGWLYEDKEWYEDFGLTEGENWGHREHLLQPGLQENHGEASSEGVVGFGVATGLYQPGNDAPSTYGAVTVFKTIDQGAAWSDERIQAFDVGGSQGCLPYRLKVRNKYSYHLDDLVSLSVSPSNIHLAEGQNHVLQVVGTYEDGEQRDLSDGVYFSGNAYSVANLVDGAVVGLRPGHATLYAQVDSLKSNRVHVTVGEGLDGDSLSDTEAGSVVPYLADNATLPAALPDMEEESVEAGFDPKSMAVYTGIAHDRYGVPMSGVQVSFLNARNYGSVVTGTDGRFIIAGPAGEQTLVYKKPGYLVIQRSAIAASSQWASLETVTLLERDSKTTTIDLSIEDPQVHESSVISDEFGDRKATVVFNGITSAVIRSADGSERPVEQFEFSATEFETPASMPGELPRETAFTWASDLHVDGAHYTDSVHFNGSVVMFVDNFLNFDVGEIVPIGYFDRRVSEWVASSNGVVVELLDSDGDGVVDGLDYTGDGLPDDLNGNGDTGDEPVGLDSYSAGDTLWWGSFNHMTPMDYNWGAGDGEAPEDVEPELSEEDEYDAGCVATGSYAKPYQQSFHEDIDIAGSNATLHYSSQRTQGYHHKIRVALSGDDLPVIPVRMIARLDIAGHVFEKSFDPQVGLEAEFLWDGTHPDGTIAKGTVNGRVSLGYEHSVKYLSAGNAASEEQSLSEFPVAWAVEGDSETLVSSRENFIAWRQRGISIKNTYDTQLAEGWSLSAVHELGPNSQGLVYLGNGGVQTIATPSLILRTGQTFSYVDGDDGYYQAGGKGIDYTITSDNILQDRVTGLQWQNVRRPHRTTRKLEAGQYCDDLDLAGQIDWRLPTPKEIGYSIDKSSGDALRRIHSLSRARELWTRSTLNVDERELAAVCVRGVELDLQNIDALERNETDQVAVDQDNGLMWQDGPDNASLELDWFDSIDYCETSQHAGYDNWRLPNINELLYVLPNSVFQHQTSFPDDTPWSPTAPERNPYWSSTTNIADEDQAWAIESLGFNSERFEKDDTYHVRCVRDDSTSSRSPFRFNGDGQHTATIDLSSGTELSNLEYDDSGRVVRIVDQFGNALTVERNHEGTPVRIVAPDGEVTALNVNQQGNLTEVLYEDDTRYQFSYGNGGLLTGKTDPNGHDYDRDYDGSGRLTMARDSEGGFWDLFDERLGIGWDRYGYETAESNRHVTERRVLDNGDVEVTTTDKTGAQSTVLRSADELTETITAYGMTTVLEKVLDQKTQRPRTDTITVTTPDGLASTTTLDKVYGENGADTSRYTVTASQNGKPVVTEVNSRSGVTKTTSAEGRVRTLHADPETLLMQRVETPGQHEREYDYDSRGRLIEERVGDRTTTYTYDDITALGQLTRITAPDGLPTHFEYDLLGRVTKVTYPDGNSTVTTYDANGNATRVTVPTSEDHTSAFNGVNKVATENRPETAPTRYTYNLERQLTQVELPSGETIDHIYENGRRVRTEAPEAHTHYHYQHGDQLARVERGAEKAHYGYDGTLQTELRYEGLVNATLGYGYNADFQIDSLSYAGASTSVGYDDDGLITAINGFDLTYDAQSGFLEELKDGNLTQTWQWNGYGESTAVDYYQSGHNTYGYSLEYNTAGQIDRKTEQAPDGGLSTYEYDYDDRGRLAEVIKDGVIVEAYAYDANGNRSLQTSTEAGVEAESATYTAGDQLESRGNTSYSYDANGRLGGKVEQTDAGPAVTTYVYGSQGQLLQVDTPDEFIEYRHNALGQRVAKLIDGEIVERYLWQDLTTLLATYDGSGNLKQRFEYTVGHTPTSFTQGGQRYYIQTDHLGSPRAVTDSSGTVVKAIRYDSYGNITDDSNPDFQIPFGFAGGLRDAHTGLVRFGYRDYDPETGRWTARDPIGFAGGDSNLYGYALGDPVNFIDPLGLWSVGDPLPQGLVNASAGFGDGLLNAVTVGVWNGDAVRGGLGMDAAVSSGSSEYQSGNLVGSAAGTLVGVGGAAKSGYSIYQARQRAMAWRSNSRTSRKTRERKIYEAGTYRPAVSTGIFSVVGAEGTSSWLDLIDHVTEGGENAEGSCW
ncbi:Lcl domain-containing protein [Marinimicrobium sp. C2-29]|uniref:Lcl domain-containing protein n=1 Tax=Marinimicrobium sp. C2-29 TaxID=3139825 RepID=UPI003139C259